jgi:DNA polymerase-3 subunit delta
MSHTLHAFDYLHSPAEPPAVVAVFGDEPFLKRLVLKELRRLVVGDDPDTPVAAYDCSDRVPDWRDVADELATASLFGGLGGSSRRLVVLERADAFVTANRPKLEDYVARPKNTGVLVLEVDEWAANTRLYKAVDSSGLQVDCRPPQRQRGKTKEIDEGAICRWVVGWGKSQHAVAMSSEAAQHLLELTGPTFGLLDQNLAKLALLVPAGTKATPDQVQEIVGGWRGKTTWDFIDAAAAGETADALAQLDRLLHAGEHPLAIFGSLSWSLRRYAAATRIFQQSERAGQKLPLREALTQAGFRDWPAGTLAAAEKRLMQLGRQRAARLYRWLVELDVALKGTHSADDRARWALEQLVFRLAKGGAARPKPPAAA